MSDADVSRLGIYQAIFTEQILILYMEILGGVIVVCTDCIAMVRLFLVSLILHISGVTLLA